MPTTNTDKITHPFAIRQGLEVNGGPNKRWEPFRCRPCSVDASTQLTHANAGRAQGRLLSSLSKYRLSHPFRLPITVTDSHVGSNWNLFDRLGTRDVYKRIGVSLKFVFEHCLRNPTVEHAN